MRFYVVTYFKNRRRLTKISHSGEVISVEAIPRIAIEVKRIKSNYTYRNKSRKVLYHEPRPDELDSEPPF